MYKCHIIVGANYGDEGKGQVTAKICKENRDGKQTVLNILTNGGSQRGHTVIDSYDTTFTHNRIKHVFHHFGAGTIYGCDNCFCPSFIINPMNFIKETNELRDVGFDPAKIAIYMDENCRWSTPYDMITNQLIEDHRNEERHGSVGIGIWETIQRYNLLEYSKTMSFGKFCRSDHSTQIEHLSKIRHYFLRRLHYEGIQLGCFYNSLFNSTVFMEHFINDCEEMYEMVEVLKADDAIKEICDNYSVLVFENGQGLLLNSDEKNVHTTPSDTRSSYAAEYIKLIEKHISKQGSIDTILHLVTRPYLTRHGNGPLPGECDKEKISDKIQTDSTNKFSSYQGHFRYAPLNILELYIRIYKEMNHCIESLPSKYNDPDIVLDITHCEECPDIVQKIKEADLSDFGDNMQYLDHKCHYSNPEDAPKENSICIKKIKPSKIEIETVVPRYSQFGL